MTKSLWSCVVLVLTACGQQAYPIGWRVDDAHLIIAPHPDDEVLMATGELVRDGGVDVILMTNGDLSCRRNGWARQAESVAGLQVLGRGEDTLHFLGYPDGFLSRLGAKVLPDVERALPDGGCGRGHETYGSRGADHRSAAEALRGHSSTYLSDNVVEDLAAEIALVQPDVITVTHGIDTHPDHSMTYVYLRQALERLHLAPMRVNRAIVHAPDCWPMAGGRCAGAHPFAPAESLPGFEGAWASYRPTSRVELGPAFASTDPAINPKAAALSRYVSQDPPWLLMYARHEEVFWPERLVAVDDQRIEREAAVPDGTPCGDYALSAEKGFLVIQRSGVVLQRQPLPQDDAFSTYELLVDPRPDDGPAVVELSVRRNGLFRMLAVDPRARARCRSVRGVAWWGTLSSRR